MFEGKHYQNAYITRDIDKAIAQFSRLTDIDAIKSFKVSFAIDTPQGHDTIVTRLSFIWLDNLQYELIQPVSGYVDIYANELPADDSLKFHHSCTRIENWDNFRARVKTAGYPVVMEGGGEALKFLYIDARDFVGHYLEYVWMTPERWRQIGGK